MRQKAYRDSSEQTAESVDRGPGEEREEGWTERRKGEFLGFKTKNKGLESEGLEGQRAGGLAQEGELRA